MKIRTTIEIDDDLLARARRALGNPTTRATVEEALRQLVASADDARMTRGDRQMRYLERLSVRGDLTALDSDEMWK